MRLTNEQKNEIRDLLAQYVDRYPSQNRAANTLVGVSAGTLSTILNGRYDTISDDMFIKIRNQIAPRKGDDWKLCETTLFKELSTLLTDAQLYQNVAWATSPAGSGKSTTVADYVKHHENAFVISCSEDMKRSDFIREMARVIGVNVADLSMHDALDRVTKYLLSLDEPLLIFDEGDKLPDTVFYYFITIYNRIEGHCGIVFTSTNYIKRRMEIGLSYNKKGYDEIHSRICRKFIDLTPANGNEVAAVAHANGIADEKTIKAVVKDAATCAFDLRRVRREVHKQKRLASLNS